MPRWRTLGAVSLTALLIGCVPLPPRHVPQARPAARTGRCALATSWSTPYASAHPLGALAPRELHVLAYRISVAPEVGRRCGQLLLTKRLTLLRGPGPLHIVEVRDFYRHGRLVAEHRGFVGRDIPASGAYRGQLTLPIPSSAPFGHYRIVSLLYARWAKGPPLLIARSQTRFAIAP